MPTKEELLEFLNIYNNPITINDTQRQVYWLIYRNVDVYCLWYDKTDQLLQYWKFEQNFERSLKFNVQKYDPVIVPDEAAKGLISCNVLNKSGEPTGKRTTMKIGRLIGLIYPYLLDSFKEKITTEIKDEHSPCDAEFNVSDTGFVRICNMSLPKATEFNTTGMQKSLKNSCMRYTANEMGLEQHPYEAYESGDFEIAWLEKGGKLYGRTIIHKASKTHSALYGINKSAIIKLKKDLADRGYFEVEYDGNQWLGSKLKVVHSSFEAEEYEDNLDDVILCPYLDFYDFDSYYDSKWIYLTDDRPEHTYRCEVQNGDGWFEP